MPNSAKTSKLENHVTKPATSRTWPPGIYNCGLRYRDFALGNRHLHAIMFQDAIPRGRESAEVGEHAACAAFGALVRTVELAAAAGVLAAPDAVEAARQIWSAVHGAIASEFRGLVPDPDPEATACIGLDHHGRGRA